MERHQDCQYDSLLVSYLRPHMGFIKNNFNLSLKQSYGLCQKQKKTTKKKTTLKPNCEKRKPTSK